MSILPTGQSGNVFSDYYKDQTQKYINGEFIMMQLNASEIEKAENILILNPKNWFTNKIILKITDLNQYVFKYFSICKVLHLHQYLSIKEWVYNKI